MRPKEQQQYAQQQEMNMEELLQTMLLGFAPSRTLMTALDLGVFSKIYEGNRTAAQIADASGASARGMQMLLDALTSLRFVHKSRDQYSLPAFVAQFLVRESPDYAGDMFNIDSIWESWGRLTEIVRTGRPYRTVEHTDEAEEFFPTLVRGLHVVNREPARRLARFLGAGARSLRVLDVAAGSGVWSIPYAEADAQTRVTAQDLPAMIPVTRSFAKTHRVEAQYDYLTGDLRKVDFGTDRFDLALLGNIVHSEGVESSRDLFRRVHGALAPGGRIAVIDMIPNNERTGPPFPLIFALNMLVNTEKGGTYTLAEYTHWLTEAGFHALETADIEWHSPVITARK